MALTPGFEALALHLQEASTALSHGDIHTRISKALSDAHAGTGEYAYPVDIFGDDKSGDVVYSGSKGMKRAKYKMGASEGKPTCSVDTANASGVVPKISYEAERTKTDPPADIVSEAIDIVGDVIPLKEGAVGQDGTAHLKLIAPGWGSSGYYSPALLERDGPKAFKQGTKSYWNHQTDAEEAARPEGDLRDLASVLTEDARYEANGPAGPGLYAKAKVFEQFRQPVDDLAKHIGMSIRAAGKAKEGTAEGRKGPIIQELSRGISVDYVTTPGAGGKILQLFEAARKPAATPIQEGGADTMDAAELKKLQEGQATLIAENRKLRERFALSDAADEARKYFKSVQVAEAVQERVLGRVLAGHIPLTEAGDLDKAKLTTIVEAQTKDELAYISKLSGGRIVTDMGGAPPQLTEAQIAEANKQQAEELDRTAPWYGLETGAGKRIFNEGRRAFDPTYNSRKSQEVTQ